MTIFLGSSCLCKQFFVKRLDSKECLYDLRFKYASLIWAKFAASLSLVARINAQSLRFRSCRIIAPLSKKKSAFGLLDCGDEGKQACPKVGNYLPVDTMSSQKT